MAKLTRDQVVRGISTEVQWWLAERLKKFSELRHETMAVNPFMAPLLFGLHSHSSFEELAEFLLGAHFMQGHATGFGKLVDEKILPRVFGTTKLDKAFRRTKPYDLSTFDEVDQIVKVGGQVTYLSLKASRWTIQLTMAVQLNAAFAELVKMRKTVPGVKFDKIVVGVIYGTEDGLTDKFRLIRGISRGAEHNVIDLQADVDVKAGRNLWTWLNEGETATQDWMMDGVLDAIEKKKANLLEASKLVANLKADYASQFKDQIKNGKIDWHAILTLING